MKKTIVAAISIAALLFTSSGANAQAACVFGVIAAAAQANWRDNRELTAQEASSCGLLYLFEAPKPKKKVARRAKHH